MKGQSLFEVILALSVSALILIGIVILATNSLRNSTFSKNNSQANNYAQEAVEWLRGQKGAGWSNFLSKFYTTSTYCFSVLNWSGGAGACSPIPGTIFTRSAQFSCYAYTIGGTTPPVGACTDVGINTVVATVTVSWSDGQGTHNAQSTTELSNWVIQ